MTASASRTFPFVSLIICLAGVIILCGLGVWQLERLQWKNNLQQQLDDAFAKAGTDRLSDEELKAVSAGQIIRGRVDGTIDFSKAILVNGRILGGQSAMAVVVPLSTNQQTHLAAELGCAVKPDIEAIRALGGKSVIVMGAVREPRWSFAAPNNNVATNQWWRLDHHDMGPFWILPDLQKNILTIENSKDFVAHLAPCPVEKNLRNDHLSYAGFWFTMAFVLLVMWGLRFLRPYLQSA